MKKFLMIITVLGFFISNVYASDIPDGKLGYPLGTYLTIAGMRPEIGKGASRSLIVDKINGKKLAQPIEIWIENTQTLPEGKRCILEGYENGEMIGNPGQAIQNGDLTPQQAPWQFYRYFIVTNIIEPTTLKINE